MRSFLSTSPRCTIEAIRELDKVFHKKPEIRAEHLAVNMSQEGKELLSVFETERDIARGQGNTADWWTQGSYRKGMSIEEQQAFAVSHLWTLLFSFHPVLDMAWHGSQCSHQEHCQNWSVIECLYDYTTVEWSSAFIFRRNIRPQIIVKVRVSSNASTITLQWNDHQLSYSTQM